MKSPALLVWLASLAGSACYTADNGVNAPPVAVSRDDVPRTFVANNPSRWPPDGPATCSVSPEGALVFQFRTDCSESGKYVGCSIADGQDLGRFHPDTGNSGVLAAKVCAEGKVNGALNLWYEDSKTRRFLPILREEDQLNGCMVKYWLPEDSCLSHGICGGFCRLSDAGVDAYPDTGDAGGDAPNLCIDASAVKLILYSEWCKQNSDGVVRLMWLRYYPSNLMCEQDGDCRPGTFCRKEGWISPARCLGDKSCPGVCSE